LKRLLLLVLASAVSACAAPPPAPLDTSLARVSLETEAGNRLHAERLDGEPVRSLQFPDLPAGAHRLEVRFMFEVAGGGGEANGGFNSGERRCILAIDYPDFQAGKRYRIHASRRGWRPAGWLLDADTGSKLASAEEVRCGPGV
tara:strand:+ start:1131 stop:1562 length:432 start_codon:yes stop_codon:yes gene_type:complete